MNLQTVTAIRDILQAKPSSYMEVANKIFKTPSYINKIMRNLKEQGAIELDHKDTRKRGTPISVFRWVKMPGKLHSQQHVVTESVSEFVVRRDPLVAALFGPK